MPMPVNRAAQGTMMRINRYLSISVGELAVFPQGLFQQLRVGEDVLDELQAPGEVEPIGDPLVQRGADVDEIMSTSALWRAPMVIMMLLVP